MIVYLAYLSEFNNTDILSLISFLPKEKKIELNLVKNEKARNKSIVSWYLLYCALKDTGITNYSVNFGENGKPYLVDLPYYFNISHSDDVVLCALSKNEVGIDIQKIKPVSESLLKKVLSKNELKTVKNSLSDFFWYWTVKESFFKQSGKGISEEFFKTDFSPFFNKKNFLYGKLTFSVEKVGDFYFCACCEDKKISFKKINNEKCKGEKNEIT